MGQLKRENNVDLNKTIVYTYDNGGNIKTKKEYPYTTGTLGTATKTITYGYDTEWKDKLTSYDGQAITYDAIGNPLTYRNGMSFTWQGRQMKNANLNGTSVSYKYNSDRLRSYKKVGETVSEYEYLGDKLVYEKRGSTQFHYRYDASGTLASIKRVKASGSSYTVYVICNSRGDIDELRNENGSLYARYVYDTWGNTLHILDANGAEITNNSSLAVQNPFRYRGYYFDSESGLYYLQSRYYDPVTGRFLNADDRLLAGIDVIGMNLFIYCSNDPINYADASGHCYYDAKGNWRHDNWEYLHGYERKPEPSKDRTIIVMSKKYTNRRDSGLSGKSDEEIIKKSKDRSLPGSERRRYQEEAKVRGLRNKQKRQSNFSVEVYKDSIVEIGKSIVGVGATAGCVYVLYRVVRMIPSIAPPLWWTIPLNAACP